MELVRAGRAYRCGGVADDRESLMKDRGIVRGARDRGVVRMDLGLSAGGCNGRYQQRTVEWRPALDNLY